MLLAAIVLGVTTAVFELTLYSKLKWLRAMIERYEWSGLILSTALALALGHLFGAVGVTVMIGGVLSMVLTQPIYFYINRGRKLLRHKRSQLISWLKAPSLHPVRS